MIDLFVLFNVADAEYVLPASEVQQMESYAGATPVPGAPGYVAGLMQIRGRVVPVIDLRSLFGLPQREPTQDSRVVVVQRAARVVALLADCAREVIRIDSGDFRAPPEIVTEQAKGFVKLVAQADKRIVLLLDSAAVLGEEKLDGEQPPHA
jgi:purine-binding chemotaxis protein CheW